LFYFLLLSRFFKGKVTSGFFGGFVVFFKWAFLKKPGGLLYVHFGYIQYFFKVLKTAFTI